MVSHRKNIRHVGRSQGERKTYIDSVFGGSSTSVNDENPSNIPETAPKQNMGDLEPIANKSGDKKSKPPYRSRTTKILDGFEDHIFGIVSFAFLTVAGIIGYLYVQQYGNNRELGEVQVKIGEVQKTIENMSVDDKDTETKQAEFDKNLSLLKKDIEYIQKLLK